MTVAVLGAVTAGDSGCRPTVIVLGVRAQIHEALLFAGGQNTTSAERLSKWCQCYKSYTNPKSSEEILSPQPKK